MATITAQSWGGVVTPTYSAVSASDQFLPDPNGLVYIIKNGGGSTDNVSITDAGSTPGGNAGTAVAFTVPAGGERHVFVNQALQNPATGFITVTHSFTTSVTAGLFRGA